MVTDHLVGVVWLGVARVWAVPAEVGLVGPSVPVPVAEGVAAGLVGVAAGVAAGVASWSGGWRGSLRLGRLGPGDRSGTCHDRQGEGPARGVGGPGDLAGRDVDVRTLVGPDQAELARPLGQCAARGGTVDLLLEVAGGFAEEE